MVSKADAADPSADSQATHNEESAQASHGNVVKRLMSMLSDNSVDPAHVVYKSISSNAASSASGNISSEMYIPK